jgi:hypothetical protein
VDYTNRDKVYFLTTDNEFNNNRIQSFPRLAQPVENAPLTTVNSFERDINRLIIQHKRSSNPNGDSLLMVSRNDQIPELSEISIAANGVGGAPAIIDSDLFSSLPAPEDFRSVSSVSFNPVNLDLYLIRDESFQTPDRFLMKYQQSNTNSPSQVLLTTTSQASRPIQCDDIRVTVGVGSSASSASAFIYCQAFSAGNIGIGTYNQNLAISNPILSVNPNSVFPTHDIGTVSCCNLSGDSDTDLDGIKDCADSAPLVALDTDNDGITDNSDACPSDFASTQDQALSGLPLGCPCLDRFDSDLDTLLNCQEAAGSILIPTGGQCFDTADADRDGTQNCSDPCPNDPNKVLPLNCGCEILETETCEETCRPGITDIGCGCGVSDCPTPRSGTILTKLTNIDSPPDIVIGQPNNDEERSVTLTFQSFAGAARVRLANALRLLGVELATRQRLTVAYDVVITKIEGNKKRNVLRRTVRANSLLVRKLPSGLYTAKYRALIRGKSPRTGEKKVMGKTAFSPSQTFSF